MLKKIALHTELTVKPWMSSATIKIMTALMTNKNNPKVKMVTGSVKKIRMGFTKILSKESTIATPTAVQ